LSFVIRETAVDIATLIYSQSPSEWSPILLNFRGSSTYLGLHRPR